MQNTDLTLSGFHVLMDKALPLLQSIYLPIHQIKNFPLLLKEIFLHLDESLQGMCCQIVVQSVYKHAYRLLLDLVYHFLNVQLLFELWSYYYSSSIYKDIIVLFVLKSFAAKNAGTSSKAIRFVI